MKVAQRVTSCLCLENDDASAEAFSDVEFLEPVDDSMSTGDFGGGIHICWQRTPRTGAIA